MGNHVRLAFNLFRIQELMLLHPELFVGKDVGLCIPSDIHYGAPQPPDVNEMISKIALPIESGSRPPGNRAERRAWQKANRKRNVRKGQA